MHMLITPGHTVLKALPFWTDGVRAPYRDGALPLGRREERSEAARGALSMLAIRAAQTPLKRLQRPAISLPWQLIRDALTNEGVHI
jgi:hypothetical protein